MRHKDIAKNNLVKLTSHIVSINSKVKEIIVAVSAIL